VKPDVKMIGEQQRVSVDVAYLGLCLRERDSCGPRRIPVAFHESGLRHRYAL